MSRDITMKEQVFASEALTEIPIPPIAGTSYRKPLASDGEIKPGWKYRDIVDSAAFNEVMYRTTSLVNQLEKDGILIWSNKTNYPKGGIAKGPTDGKLYQAVQASGPGTPAGTKDPTNGANPTYWVDYLDSVEPYSLPTASGSVKGGVKIGDGLTMDGETLNVTAYSLPTASGSITLNGTTNNTVVMTDIVTELGLEAGDVIRIEAGVYNKLHTVESITNNNSVIVNYEHARNKGNGSLKLPDFTGQVTVTRIAKRFNAPIGLGQAWLDVTASRTHGVTYTNSTGRTIQVLKFDDLSAANTQKFYLNGVLVFSVHHDAGPGSSSISILIPSGDQYSYSSTGSRPGSVKSWMELR